MNESEVYQPPTTKARCSATDATCVSVTSDEADQAPQQAADPNITAQDAHPYNLLLSIPDPESYYDAYHHPLFPLVLPQLHAFADPEHSPGAFPQPLGPNRASQYNVLGATLHDFSYVNMHPEKRFTKYMLWYLEVNDYLIRLICPSDLNDMPCEWDELQGGCRMLRLCEMKHKFPHPHLGRLPECASRYRHYCKFIHDIEPNCRSLGKQLVLPVDERFRTWQRCDFIADGRCCWWGHDLESTRTETVYEYWRHREAARQCGACGFVKWDNWNRRLAWRPICPVDLRLGLE